MWNCSSGMNAFWRHCIRRFVRPFRALAALYLFFTVGALYFGEERGSVRCLGVFCCVFLFRQQVRKQNLLNQKPVLCSTKLLACLYGNLPPTQQCAERNKSCGEKRKRQDGMSAAFPQGCRVLLREATSKEFFFLLPWPLFLNYAWTLNKCYFQIPCKTISTVFLCSSYNFPSFL